MCFRPELGVPDETKLACLGMSLAFLPFALMTGAAAHALQHQKEIINCVALMLIMELFFMAAMVCLFAINLAHGATGMNITDLKTITICITAVLTVGLLMLGIDKFKRPSPFNVCCARCYDGDNNDKRNA